MTEQRLPWYKRFPADFIASTVGMSWEVKCAYSLVLDLIYLGGGSIADDGAWVANMLGVGMTTRRWNLMKIELIEKGKIIESGGRLYNPRAARELGVKIAGTLKPPQNVTAIAQVPFENPDLSTSKNGGKNRDKSTDLGQAKDLVELSGQKTWQKTPVSDPVPARARENRAEQSRVDTADVIVQVEAIAEVLKQKRGRYWEADYRRLLEDGLEYSDILEAAKAHRGDPIRGMGALRALAMRKRDDRVYQRKTPAPPPQADRPPNPGAVPDKDWEFALVLMLKNGGWNEPKLGPPPTRPGCLCPAHLIEGWRRLWKLQGEHPVQEYDAGTNLVDYPADRPDAFMRAMWMPNGDSTP